MNFLTNLINTLIPSFTEEEVHQTSQGSRGVTVLSPGSQTSETGMKPMTQCCHSKSLTTCPIPPFPLSRTTGPPSQTSSSTGNHSPLARNSMCTQPPTASITAHTPLCRGQVSTPVNAHCRLKNPQTLPLLPKRFIIKPAKN